jgi:hypothetical protein
MNKYKVWYSYTEPSCDCPFVLVTSDNMFFTIKAESHHAAKKELKNNNYMSRTKENFEVLNSKLIEKNCERLKSFNVNVNSNNKITKQGYATSFMFNGEEIAIVAKSESMLQSISDRLFTGDKKLESDKNTLVNISKADES